MSVLLGDDLSGSNQWETKVLVEVLVGVVSLDFGILHDSGLDDLDVAGHGSVSTSHIVVHLPDGASQSGVSVLLVHIVGAASASVTEPNGEVLDLARALVEDLSNIQDFSAGALGLCQGLHIVPELGLSNDLVTSEDLHSENLGARVLGGGGSTTDQLVEVHLWERMVCVECWWVRTFIPREAVELSLLTIVDIYQSRKILRALCVFLFISTPIQGYSISGRIGQGTYSVVYRGRRGSDSAEVAIKQVSACDASVGWHKCFARELTILRNLSDPHIIRILDVIPTPGYISVMLEYGGFDLGYLMEHVIDNFSLSDIKCLGIQLLQALRYLHGQGYMHRDVKPSNVLISADGMLKLADFGMARSVESMTGVYTTDVVTLWYRCPEILEGNGTYSNKVDMWSAGCVLGELVHGGPLIPGSNEMEQLSIARSFSVRDTLKLLDESFKSLLGGLLTSDPIRRLSATASLLHDVWSVQPFPTPLDSMPTLRVECGPLKVSHEAES